MSWSSLTVSSRRSFGPKGPGWFTANTREEVLAAALPRSARLIVVALPDAFQARRVISLARKFNPSIETVVRTHSEAEALYLAESGVGLAVMG